MARLLKNEDLQEVAGAMGVYNTAKESSRPLQESVDDMEEPSIKERRNSKLSAFAVAITLLFVLSAAVVAAMVGVNHHHHHHPAQTITTKTSNAIRRRLQEALGTCPFQLKVNVAVPPTVPAASGGGALCIAPPTMFDMFYRSESCAVSSQSITNYLCQDFNGGTRTIPANEKVYISAMGSDGQLLYSGSHFNGTAFYIWNLLNPLPNVTTLEISSDINRTQLLQRVTFPSTCNVAGGDILSNTFGAVQITGFSNDKQGSVTVAPTTPIAAPSAKATFTLSLSPSASPAASYTLTLWQFQTNYTDPNFFLIPMEGTVLDATGVQTTLELRNLNLARLPQTLETYVSVSATSTLNTVVQECEVYLTDLYTISADPQKGGE